MIDRAIHAAGEELEVPYRHAEAASWRVAAELVRRHPDRLVVIEMHPGTGQYDCLALCTRERDDEDVHYHPILMMNRMPRGHIDVEVGAAPGDSRPNWLDVILSVDIRDQIVIPIERKNGLVSPKETPPTTAQSIGVRVIAELLTARSHGQRALAALNGVLDSSGMGGTGVRDHLFAAFARLREGIQPDPVGDVLGEPAYRYWFVVDEDEHRTEPIAAFDTWNGLVWTKKLSGANLMSMYDESDRSVACLVSRILPH